MTGSRRPRLVLHPGRFGLAWTPNLLAAVGCWLVRVETSYGAVYAGLLLVAARDCLRMRMRSSPFPSSASRQPTNDAPGASPGPPGGSCRWSRFPAA